MWFLWGFRVKKKNKGVLKNILKHRHLGSRCDTPTKKYPHKPTIDQKMITVRENECHCWNQHLRKPSSTKFHKNRANFQFPSFLGTLYTQFSDKRNMGVHLRAKTTIVHMPIRPFDIGPKAKHWPNFIKMGQSHDFVYFCGRDKGP